MSTDREPNPVKDPGDTPDLRRALERACAERNLSTEGAQLIHHYSNAVYLLPAERAVARITTGAARRVYTAHALTRWLVDETNVAATAPLPGVNPVSVDSSTIVSFWTYYPQPDAKAEPTSTHLARILLALHVIDSAPVELEQWQPLLSLSAALRDPSVANRLSHDDFQWLSGRVEDVQAAVQGLDSPLGYGIIHGDAWAGNLLWDTATGSDAAVLGDWDWVAIGPREVDLIPTWHAAIRYGRGKQWADAFAGIYGYDLAAWGGFPTLLAMRDLVQLTGPLRRASDGQEFKTALQQRLSSMRAGDARVWRAL